MLHVLDTPLLTVDGQLIQCFCFPSQRAFPLAARSSISEACARVLRARLCPNIIELPGASPTTSP